MGHCVQIPEFKKYPSIQIHFLDGKVSLSFRLQIGTHFSIVELYDVEGAHLEQIYSAVFYPVIIL